MEATESAEASMGEVVGANVSAAGDGGVLRLFFSMPAVGAKESATGDVVGSFDGLSEGVTEGWSDAADGGAEASLVGVDDGEVVGRDDSFVGAKDGEVDGEIDAGVGLGLG